MTTTLIILTAMFAFITAVFIFAIFNLGMFLRNEYFKRQNKKVIENNIKKMELENQERQEKMNRFMELLRQHPKDVNLNYEIVQKAKFDNGFKFWYEAQPLDTPTELVFETVKQSKGSDFFKADTNISFDDSYNLEQLEKRIKELSLIIRIAHDGEVTVEN